MKTVTERISALCERGYYSQCVIFAWGVVKRVAADEILVRVGDAPLSEVPLETLCSLMRDARLLEEKGSAVHTSVKYVLGAEIKRRQGEGGGVALLAGSMLFLQQASNPVAEAAFQNRLLDEMEARL